MKVLSFPGLPQLAIAAGDSTPNPGYPAYAWSTTLGLPVFWDGTRWLSGPYDVSSSFLGIPWDAAVLITVPVARPVLFPANFAGSVCKSSIAATASTVLSIWKDSTQIGTITFAAAGTTGTFASTGSAAQSLTAGQVLEVRNQATADLTLESIATVLVGVR